MLLLCWHACSASAAAGRFCAEDGQSTAHPPKPWPPSELPCRLSPHSTGQISWWVSDSASDPADVRNDPLNASAAARALQCSPLAAIGFRALEQRTAPLTTCAGLQQRQNNSTATTENTASHCASKTEVPDIHNTRQTTHCLHSLSSQHKKDTPISRTAMQPLVMRTQLLMLRSLHHTSNQRQAGNATPCKSQQQITPHAANNHPSHHTKVKQQLKHGLQLVHCFTCARLLFAPNAKSYLHKPKAPNGNRTQSTLQRSS